MKLIPCNRSQLVQTFKERTAKYLSQHNETRHYTIKYHENKTFETVTYENNRRLGIGWGIYEFVGKPEECQLNIQYESIYPSPYMSSPMNPSNPFYPKLKNYVIGPFYTRIPDTHVMWLPVLYNHLQLEKGFKVLNFYR